MNRWPIIIALMFSATFVASGVTIYLAFAYADPVVESYNTQQR